MNRKHKIEPSILIDFKGEKIAVSSLPDEIRYEIETLDRFTQDKLDLIYEVEKVDLAIKMKTLIINSQILQWKTPKADPTAPNTTETKPENEPESEKSDA